MCECAMWNLRSLFIKTFYHPGGFACIILAPNFVGDFIPDDGHSCRRHLSQMSSLIRMQYVPSGLGSRSQVQRATLIVYNFSFDFSFLPRFYFFPIFWWAPCLKIAMELFHKNIWHRSIFASIFRSLPRFYIFPNF